MRRPQWVRSPLWLILLLAGPANAQEASVPAGADPPAPLVSCRTSPLLDGPAAIPPVGETACQWEGPGSTRVEARVDAGENGVPLAAADALPARRPRAPDAGLALSLSLGADDSRFRLATRYGLSRRDVLLAAAVPDGGSPGRGDLLSGELGHAVLAHADLDVWRRDEQRIIAFGGYRRTDSLFAKVGGSRTSEGFGPPDRSVLEGGLRLSAPWVSLKLSQERSERGISKRRSIVPARTETTRGELAIDLGAAGERLATRGRLARLAPSALWLRGSAGHVWRERSGDDRAKAIADIAGGATWGDASYQTTLSVWRSVSGTHHPFADDPRGSDTGARIDAALWGEHWELSGTAGFHRERSRAGEAVQRIEGFQGSLAFSLDASPESQLSARLSFGDTAAASPGLPAPHTALSLDAWVELAAPAGARGRLHAGYALGFTEPPASFHRAAHALHAALELEF